MTGQDTRPSEPALGDLADKEDIQDVLHRYCRGIDRMDEELLRSCYHDDAFDDHGMFQGPASEFVPYALQNLATMKQTMHCIHNVLIELHGDVAVSEAYLVAYHRMASSDGGEADHVVGGRYVDRFERRGGTWRISKRVVVYEWTRIDPVGRQWTIRPEYTLGRRDADDVSYRMLNDLRDGTT